MSMSKQKYEYVDAEGTRQEIPSMRAKVQAKTHAFAPGVHAAVVDLMKARGLNYVDAFDLLKASRPEIFQEGK